jgi:hypothetical protein
MTESRIDVNKVIEWLSRGDRVICEAHVKGTLFEMPFHDCNGVHETGKQIRLNVDTNPVILYHDQWPWHIKNAGFKECQCKFIPEAEERFVR